MKKRLLSILPFELRKNLRTAIFRAQHRVHKVRFLNLPTPQNGWPRILVMSIPKSGTHLLTQILTGLSKISPFAPYIPFVYNSRDPITGQVLPVEYPLSYLKRINPLDICAAHMICYSETAQVISGNAFINYFIYRDPRDILVSYAHFFGDMEPDHRLHRHLHPLTLGQRITALISGEIDGKPFDDNIAVFISNFLGWLDKPSILSVRYEDLINNRLDTLGNIADHFLHRVNILPQSRAEIIRVLESNIDPRRSPTFRSGRTGDWRTHFTEGHKKLFKEVAGDLLVKLEYEKDNSW